MAIKAWGAGSLTFTEITTEFTGGAQPHSLSEYYASGSYVQAGATGTPNGTTTNIPTAGTISFSNFYGAAKLVAALSPTTQTITTTQNSAMTSSTAFTATDFVGAVTYTISPALPSGLSINSSTGVISGTPTTTQGATSYTITGTGATSGSATSTLSLTITAAAATLSPTSQTVSGTAGSAITNTTAFTTANFTGAITYSISPALPSGLSLNTSSGVISGTPSASQTATSYTITATGATSGSATSTVSITVAAAGASGWYEDWTDSGYVAFMKVRWAGVDIPYGTAGTQIVTSFPINGATWTGNSDPNATFKDNTNGFIYTKGALDTQAGATNIYFVTRAAIVASISPSTQTVSATQNSAITSTTAFTKTNFSGTVTFAVSPSLPAGLSLNTTTGVISGTPTATQSATSYTITATGSTSGSATATVSITVSAAAGATFTTTGLNGVFLAAESFGSGRTAGVTIIFKNNGSVVYQETEFPFGDQLMGAGTWLASGSASGVSIRATQTGVGTGDIGSAPAGSSISASTGWLSLANNVTLAGVDCGPSGTTAMLTQPYLIEFSNDGGATTAASYTVEIGGEIYV